MKHSLSQEEKFKMMTDDPLPSVIIRLAIPTMISMLVTAFYNMADTFFVGQISTSATAAVGVAFPVMAVIQAAGFFCGHGSGNSMSRKLGAKDHEAAEQLAAIGFYLAIFVGVIITIVGLIFLKPLSLLLGSTETILPHTEAYLGIILLGAPYMTAQFVLNNQLRFQGNAFYAMLGIASGAIINIILDPIFIFVWNMGVAGAALATIISQLISFSLLLAGIRISTCIPIRLKNLKHIKEHLLTIAGGGLPSLFRQGLASIATLALNLSANTFGDAAIAAMSIVGRITMFANSALIGFGQGFQPVCGYNYGAGKYKRVQEAFWFCVKVATGGLLIFSALGIVFAEPLVTIFRKDDPSVISIGSTALRMQCVTFTLGGWVLMNNMLMQTIGKTMRASILAAARQGLFFLPAILILPYFLQLTGIQLAQPVADVFAFFLAVILNRRTMKELAHPIERTQSI